jgi:UDPglucose 6-dehydrogenase
VEGQWNGSGRISVIGLGKLGAPLAAVLAAKGFDVAGVDRNPKFTAALRSGLAPFGEPGLQELLSRARVTTSDDVQAAVLGSETTFIVVPTPSKPNGMFSHAHVIAAVREIGAALRRKQDYHLVVVSSTVMPGATDGAIREALEAASGRVVGERLGLCYSPEFVALGSVIHDLLNPDFVLIGESNTQAGDRLEAIYRAVCENRPPIQRMNCINAELTKLALNAFVTAKISFANMISELCDRRSGADAAVVAAALGLDSRIGGKYLKPGLAFGGPCFPRDNAAFASMARANGVAADIPEATDRINRRQLARVMQLVRGVLARGTVAVLGLSYKPGSAVIEASAGIAIASTLADAGYRVLISDPEALGAAAAVLGGKVEAASTEDCVAGADVVIIATPWPCYSDLPTAARQRAGRPLRVIDCWRLLAADSANIELIYLGRGGEEPAVDAVASSSGQAE